jgi:hypothetical protein
VDRHRFDDDPDPNFHVEVDLDSDLDPNPDCHKNDVNPHEDPPTSFTHVGKPDFLFHF